MKWDITTDIIDICRIIQTTMNNLEEMDKFLETYNLPQLHEEEIENMNRPITSKELQTSKQKTYPGTDDFTS